MQQAASPLRLYCFVTMGCMEETQQAASLLQTSNFILHTSIGIMIILTYNFCVSITLQK